MVYKKLGLNGAIFNPINPDSNYFQLVPSANELELTNRILFGHNPFNKSRINAPNVKFEISGGYKVEIEKEIYMCPLGHTIGPRLLSEVFVGDASFIHNNDIYVT